MYLIQRRLTFQLRAVRQTLLLGLALSTMTGGSAAWAGTIATWTFETTQPGATAATIGPLAPEIGAGGAIGVHALATTVWSTPAGNGSSHSFSSNMWSAGDYLQFQVSTVGLQNILLSWDQTSSGTGPSSFDLKYSTDGSHFTDVGNYTVAFNLNPPGFWNATTPVAGYSFSHDFSAIAALANAPSVEFRLINNVTTASAGTDRVDNVTVTGTAVPEPGGVVLAALGMIGLAMAGLRRLARCHVTKCLRA